MKSIIILLLMLCGISAIAQPTSDRGWYNKKDIEKTDIGWINVLQFKEPAKPFSQNGWTYSAKQIDFGQKMATWVQQTYLPKGVLGEMKVSVYAQPPSAPMSSSSYVFNEAEKNNRNALPNTYGMNAKMYMLLQKTSTKKFWPIDGLADYVPWGTPGIQLQLKKDKYQFSIDVSPGDMNRKKAAGWVMMNHYMPDGYNDCKIGSYYCLPDFSGDEQVNRATMAIQRKGERVAVLCNGQEVFACNKGIPANMIFNDIRFVVNEKNVYHISNILIKK